MVPGARLLCPRGTVCSSVAQPCGHVVSGVGAVQLLCPVAWLLGLGVMAGGIVLA